MKQKKGLPVLFLFLACSLAFAQQDTGPIQLPPPQTDIGQPLMKALSLRRSSRSFSEKPLSLQELSNLLWAAHGINRPGSGKLTAPSAMNWQEVDVYVALPEGLYLHEVKGHRLEPVVSKDLRRLTGRQSFVGRASVNLIYVVDFSRVSRGNREDTTVWSAAGVGFIAQNVYLYCASQGLNTVVRGLIDKRALSKAMNLGPEQVIILAQTVGYPE